MGFQCLKDYKLKRSKYTINTKLIPTPGLEPGPNKGQGFKPCMSTSSII